MGFVRQFSSQNRFLDKSRDLFLDIAKLAPILSGVQVVKIKKMKKFMKKICRYEIES